MYSPILNKVGHNEPVEREPREESTKVIDLVRVLAGFDMCAKGPFSSAWWTMRFIRLNSPNNLHVLARRFDYWFNFYNL